MERRLLALAVALALASFVLHLPPEAQGALFGTVLIKQPLYNDLWSRAQGYVAQGRTALLPYVDVNVAEPPLYVAVLAALVDLSNAFGDYGARALAFNAAQAALAAAGLAIGLSALEELGGQRGGTLRKFLWASYVIYGAYSLEPLSLALIALSLRELARGRRFAAGLAAGLAASLSAPALALLAVELAAFAAEWSPAGMLGVLAGSSAYAASIPFPGWASSFISSLMGPNINNGLWNLLTARADAAEAYGLGGGVLMAFAFGCLVLARREAGDPGAAASIAALAIAGSIVLSPAFTPQLMVILIPLHVALFGGAETALRLSDLLNSMIIPLWFADAQIREQLAELGFRIVVEQNPMSLSSPVQWIAQARNLLCLYVLYVEAAAVSRLIRKGQ
ncbi:MAG: hypothetical protein ABWK00_03460 [Desulfurococcaceae archaeon]